MQGDIIDYFLRTGRRIPHPGPFPGRLCGLSDPKVPAEERCTLAGLVPGYSGWAGGALAVTMLIDYVQPTDEEQIWSIWKGNARG